MEYPRELPPRRDVEERVQDFREVEGPVEYPLSVRQASRCMNCGTPFCHQGCPLGNNISEFNQAVGEENWDMAYEILEATNNFPEFTGRICPAPCEASCVLGINKPAVTIEYLEKSIAERAFESGFVVPQLPAARTGRKVAVVGSGPAGLAAAAQLNRAGHHVTVFERAEAPGGLLRFGIPDFKLDKSVLERRLDLMRREGVSFMLGRNLETGEHVQSLRTEFDAVVLTIGSTVPRNMSIPGRHFSGIHYAMDFLTNQNRIVSGSAIGQRELLANGRNVVILGGGDTGADCVGTSLRQRARSVSQLEILDQPPRDRTPEMPWPNWPMILRTSSSHEEGGSRTWRVLTKSFEGNAAGQVTGLRVVSIAWNTPRTAFTEVPASEQIIPADMVLLAMGFTGPERGGLLERLNLKMTAQGLVECCNFQTSIPGVFAAGDMRRGQSLVVWAIHEGREAAKHVDRFIMRDPTREFR